MTSPTRKLVSALVVLLLLALMVWVDVHTGQWSVFPLYIIPVVYATWFLGRGGGLWVSLLATVAHRWADWPADSKVNSNWVIAERGLSSLILLVFIVCSFHIFKLGRKIDRERIQRLESLLRVCPACDRVHQNDGQWKSLEACLAEQPVVSPAQRLCPECTTARPPADDSL